jgi:hypothetical protein
MASTPGCCCCWTRDGCCRSPRRSCSTWRHPWVLAGDPLPVPGHRSTVPGPGDHRRPAGRGPPPCGPGKPAGGVGGRRRLRRSSGGPGAVVQGLPPPGRGWVGQSGPARPWRSSTLPPRQRPLQPGSPPPCPPHPTSTSSPTPSRPPTGVPGDQHQPAEVERLRYVVVERPLLGEADAAVLEQLRGQPQWRTLLDRQGIVVLERVAP